MKVNIEFTKEVEEALIELARIPIPAGVEQLAIGIHVSDDADLDQFQLRAHIGHAEFTLASATGDFDATPTWPVVRASGDLTVLAAAADGYAIIDTRGLADIAVYAATASFAALFATGTLTAGSNPADGSTVTIGSVTYTIQAVLVDTANNVLRGATASDTLDNLIAAITAGAGAGTLYGTGTVEHPDVDAAAGTGDTMDVTAKVGGRAGNSIATTAVSAALTWGASTLTGGKGPTDVTVSFFG